MRARRHPSGDLRAVCAEWPQVDDRRPGILGEHALGAAGAFAAAARDQRQRHADHQG